MIDAQTPTHEEIDGQLVWHDKVMKRVLKETGCFLSHQAIVIVVQEFAVRVKELEGSGHDG